MTNLTVSISQPQQRKDFFLLPLSPLLKQAPAGSLRRRHRPRDPEPRPFPPAATAGAAATATTAALPAQFSRRWRRPLGAGVSRKRRRGWSAATAALWRRTGQRTSRATPRYGRSPQSPSLGLRSPGNTYEEERKRKEEELLAVHRTYRCFSVCVQPIIVFQLLFRTCVYST